MEDFYRIRRLPPYVFEQVNRAKAAARNAGADIIDLGMGNPDLPTPPHVIEKLKETLGKPRTDRYSASRGITGLRKAQAAYYGAAFWRQAQSGHPDRRDAGLEGGFCQRRAGDHRAGRRRAVPQSELSDPRLRLPDGGRRDPLGAVGTDAAILRGGGARDHPFDPEAAGARRLLSLQSDRLCREPRFLQGSGRVREEARDLHPVRSRLCRSLFRRQEPAALGAAGARRDRRHRRIHLDVEDVLDGRLAHGICGRQRAHHRRTGAGQILSRLRRVHADPGRGDRRAERPGRLHPRDARHLSQAPRRAGGVVWPRRMGDSAAAGLDVRLGAAAEGVPRRRQHAVRDPDGREVRRRGFAGRRASASMAKAMSVSRMVENEQRIRQAARGVRRFLESGIETLHNVVPLANRR